MYGRGTQDSITIWNDSFLATSWLGGETSGDLIGQLKTQGDGLRVDADSADPSI